MNVRRITIVPALVFIIASTSLATPRELDAHRSRITVYVSKSGAFSAFGHNHEIAAPIASGRLDEDAHTVEFNIRVREMQVLDPRESESDRTKVRDTMLGPQVLDSERFPEISFVSTSVVPAKDGFEVRGRLTLHGTARDVVFPVTLSGERYSGRVTLKQTDFGITPIKVFGGSVSVKNELEIRFEIVAIH